MLLVGRAGQSFGHHAHRPAIVLAALLCGALTFAFYWWSQHWLLAGRVRWRPLLPGSIIVGLGTAVVFRLTRVIMPGSISWQVHAYGLVGVVFVLSVWLMILSAVIFGGILFGALLAERRRGGRPDPASVEGTPLSDSGLESAGSNGTDETDETGTDTDGTGTVRREPDQVGVP